VTFCSVLFDSISSYGIRIQFLAITLSSFRPRFASPQQPIHWQQQNQANQEEDYPPLVMQPSVQKVAINVICEQSKGGDSNAIFY